MRRPRLHQAFLTSLVACVFVASEANAQAAGDQTNLNTITLQRRLLVAQDNALILVPAGEYGDITVPRPMRIIGENRNSRFTSLRLEGPGFGETLIDGVTVAGDENLGPVVVAVGLNRVKVHDSDIQGSLASRGVPYVEVSDSKIEIGEPDHYIDSPGASVAVVDCIMPDLSGNTENTVIADNLYASATTLPSPQLIRDDLVILDNDLSIVGPTELGGSMRVDWSIPGRFAHVFVSLNTRTPTDLDLNGNFWFLGNDAFFVASGRSPGSAIVPIPADVSLVGTSFGVQAINGFGPSRPDFGVVR